MANVFINGLNSKTGGGKNILVNYLILLNTSKLNNKYFVLTPDVTEYSQYSNTNITILGVSNILKNAFLLPFTYYYSIPKLISRLNIELIFNLADIPIPCRIQQIFLFDWPYAVYPKSIVWDKMDLLSFVNRKIKLYLFKRNIKYVTKWIAQTNTIKRRLQNTYNISNIIVVANAISISNLKGEYSLNFSLPNGRKLLYLTYYYPHKNLEILIPLAKEIKRRELDFKIIITVEAQQHRNVHVLFKKIKDHNLESIVYNIGSVKMKDVPSLYNQCDALLMPTLLETYGLPYLEAMYHGKLVLTSNLDFAKDVCNEAGIYFDPENEFSILDNIIKVFNNRNLYNEKILNGKKIVNNLNSWDDVFRIYSEIIEEELNS